MKIKDKVKYWLEKYSYLRDDDNRLCANIWNDEVLRFTYQDSPSYRDFLRLYSAGKLTPATSIRRARAKIQEENPSLRGEKYFIRKGQIQDNFKKEYGYKVNK